MSISTYLRRHYILSTLLLFFIAVAVVLRLYFGQWMLNYVNDSLDHIGVYHGSVADINIDLYRGAYRIHDLKIVKKNANSIPTPFVSIEDLDLSIQWRSLIHGKVVSDIELYKPVINFAVSKSNVQNGVDTDWTQPIKALAPIDINHVIFENGSVTYQDFSSTPKVDIYIHHMDGEIHNLRNVVNTNQPLPSRVELTGDSIGKGKLKITGRMNILKQVPDMDLKTELENVYLPALSDYSNAYAAVDIKDGNLNVYSEFIIKDNQVSGYVKPIASHISLIDLRKDSNPVKLAWESVVSVVLQLFTNLHKDQFATKIQLEGNLDNIQTSTWSAIGGIFHNAFISALKNGMDSNIEGNPPQQKTYKIQ
jgi:hypothetical protein